MIQIDRVWAMPNHHTFEIPPIKQFIEQEERNLDGPVIDPFPYPFEVDAIEFLKGIPPQSVKKVRFDPPYSQRQLIEKYHNAGIALDHPINSGYWADCKAEIARILKPGGKCLSFGWNSGGIGLQYGFEITRIRLVCHGGQHNDTICVSETRIQTTLF